MTLEGRETTAGEVSVRLVPRPDALQDLLEHDELRIPDVPTTAGEVLSVRLRRVPLVLSEDALHVDGVPTPFDSDAIGLTLWRGSVDGVEDSDVLFGFSTYGCRGWIRRPGRLDHLLAGPGPGGDWSRSVSRLVTEDSLNLLGHELGEFCGVRRSDERFRVPPMEGQPSDPSLNHVAGAQPILICRLAFETDFQLFQVFGNATAETTYLNMLLSAVSGTYQGQLASILRVVYLMIYTNSNDPWTTPDGPGTTLQMLTEFGNAWANNLPNGAHLGHFGSGVASWGGIAWVGALCDPGFGFGVSGGLTGTTPFPPVQGPLIWDFVVVAHELGHNFGTWHTHDYCPVIDACSTPALAGICQPGQTCSGNGTIMSYCHLCPGGVSNITPTFHPDVASFMRMIALWSCLGR